MQTIATFVSANLIEAIAYKASANPLMSDMPEGSKHWRMELKRPYRGEIFSMSVLFSQGPALTKPPTVWDVLDCLASDAAGYENANHRFEEWASEYGYDEDSRKAYRIYEAVSRQTCDLKSFLGLDLFNSLLWHTERL